MNSKKKSIKKNKNVKKDKNESNNPDLMPNLLQNMPQITDDVKKNLEEIKKKVEKFRDQIVEKFEDYIKGIAILPPEKPGEKLKDISIVVLVDDSDSKTMSKPELYSRLTEVINEVSTKIDKSLKPEIMLLSDLREACYDSKYEVLKMLALAAPIYDPADFIAAIRVSEIHKEMTIKKFEKYILSYVAAGSLFRGEKSNDIDVYVIIDDTDVKKMTRVELKDRLRAIILSMGAEASRIAGVEKQFHVQTYILTDFWDNLKDANPVIFTLLRDGVPIYDRGVFMAWKLLLSMGKVKPSPEAIDMSMDIGEKLLTRVKHKMLSVVAEDLYYAVLNPAQAALMRFGLPPATPKDTIKLMNEVFVQKEKILEKKYVDVLESAYKMYKNIEHGKVSEVSGKEIDDLFKNAKEYLDRIKKLFDTIEEKTQKESVLDIYQSCVSIIKDILMEISEEKVDESELIDKFESVLVKDEGIKREYLKIFKDVVKAKADFEKNKLTKQEITKVKRDSRRLIRDLVEYMQRKKINVLDRKKIKFTYNKDKIGEAIILKDKIFIIKDLQKKDEVLFAEIKKDGSLNDLKPAKPEDLEKSISKIDKDKKLTINENLISNLNKIVDEDIEILINY